MQCGYWFLDLAVSNTDTLASSPGHSHIFNVARIENMGVAWGQGYRHSMHNTCTCMCTHIHTMSCMLTHNILVCLHMHTHTHTHTHTLTLPPHSICRTHLLHQCHVHGRLWLPFSPLGRLLHSSLSLVHLERKSYHCTSTKLKHVTYDIMYYAVCNNIEHSKIGSASG